MQASTKPFNKPPRRAQLEQAVLDQWQRRGVMARLLYPLSAAHQLWRSARVGLHRFGWTRATRLPVPVVVIGNLYVGGTGKTPLTMELVRALRDRGWHPGVISRGYGARNRVPRPVILDGSAHEYGDEPYLIARNAHVPVVVGNDRAAAGRLLLNLHPQVDVLIADDGLQHQRLARDVEIALVHYRGLGNGWLLPAGPLRDPPQRLARVDAVVFHGATPTVRVYSPFFRMQTQCDDAYALKDPSRRVTLAELALEQQQGKLRILAAAGIGMPERFFEMLRSQGLQIEAMPLGDHYDFARNPFEGHTYDVCLITEKDAVKCAAVPHLAADGRICVVPLKTDVDSKLFDLVEAKLRARDGEAAVPNIASSSIPSPQPTTQRTSDGPSLA